MKTLRLVMVAGLAALSPLLSGCGGGSSSCGKVQPCGGDVKGTWSASSTCTSSKVDTTCPGETGTSVVSVSGPAIFNADLSYSMALTENGWLTVDIPSSCLKMAGFALTCEELGLVLRSLLQNSQQPWVQSVDCTTGLIGCTCTEAISGLVVNDKGTYMTSGTTLALSAGRGGSYCIQANELHLLTLDTTMNMGPMGQVAIATDLVFRK